MTKLPVADSAEPRTVIKVSCSKVALHQRNRAGPIYLDMMDGRAYRLPASAIATAGTGNLTLRIPVADWPVLIADSAFAEAALH
jgi:hypothetical protein